jgi:hypothetical protein
MRRSARAIRGPLRWAALLGLVVLGACATLQQIAALRAVDFTLDRVAGVRLAGVLLDDKRGWGDVSVTEAARLTIALSQGRMPLEFDLFVEGTNPPDNSVDARLVRMDWTLLLEDRETITGVFDREVVFPPGRPTDFPIAISLDLREFFEGSAQDLAELALALSGQGGSPKSVALRAVPTIETAIGPLRYPSAITILSTEVGGEDVPMPRTP